MKIRKKVQEIELRGSDKQKEWCVTIRDKKAQEAERLGYSGVLKIMRPYVTEEILQRIGATDEKSILTLAHWTVMRLFSEPTCFQWIANRTRKTEDEIDETARKAIREWSENPPFNK
jgi:hypothetical protein